jgi:hypothetical protein
VSAYELTALQASALVPLVLSELSEERVLAWIQRARSFSLRRLRDDVELALELRERDYRVWLRTGGIPEEPAGGDTGMEGERETGAKPTVRDRGIPLLDETCRLGLILDAEVGRIFRAVLCSVRRLLEQETGRPASPSDALAWMCRHVLEAWGAHDPSFLREHRIFVRDGWRCAVPGCTRMSSLHAHHVIFRVHGGGDEAENLITLCAYHHLRGVHGGILRIAGRAPAELRFEIGIRAERPPLALYASGDRRVAA